VIAAMLNEQSDEEEIHVTSHVTNYPAEKTSSYMTDYSAEKPSASNLLPTSLLANNLIDYDGDICYTPISLIDYQLDYQMRSDTPMIEAQLIWNGLLVLDYNLMRDHSNLSNDSIVNTPKSLSLCDEFSYEIDQVNYLPIRTNQEINSDITIESAYNLMNSDLSTTKVIFIIDTAATICAVSKLDLFDSVYKTNKTIMWGNV
jgi:hypothetical protein